VRLHEAADLVQHREQGTLEVVAHVVACRASEAEEDDLVLRRPPGQGGPPPVSRPTSRSFRSRKRRSGSDSVFPSASR